MFIVLQCNALIKMKNERKIKIDKNKILEKTLNNNYFYC